MQDLLPRFIQFCQTHELFNGGKKVLIALSGGLDSVVMTHLFLRAELPFALAHCNFQLRGKESDADAEFVKMLAKKHRIKFHYKKFNTEEYANEHKVSIQMAARQLRYIWFRTLTDTGDYQSLATAHHLDDSIETFFINLLRGTGIQGLTGIPEKRDQLIRPLSGFTRKEIQAYAISENLSWREDSSNASEDYLRNRIRQKMIPLLFELQPGFPEVMLKNFEHLRQTAYFQNEIAGALKKKYLIEEARGKWKINILGLKKEQEAEAKLQLLLQEIGIKSQDIHSMMKTGNPGKKFFSGEFRILRDRSFLLIEKMKEPEQGTLLLSGKNEDFYYSNMSIHVEKNKIHGKTKLEGQLGSQDLDVAKLKFPLQVRPWKAGDYFYPLGMKQRKKVSDFLIDKKVNRFDKEKCLVVLSGNDIVCILGHRIDDRYKITSVTENIYSITINTQ